MNNIHKDKNRRPKRRCFYDKHFNLPCPGRTTRVPPWRCRRLLHTFTCRPFLLPAADTGESDHSSHRWTTSLITSPRELSRKFTGTQHSLPGNLLIKHKTHIHQKTFLSIHYRKTRPSSTASPPKSIVN